MGLFDKLAKRSDEKKVDKVIENVKGLIAERKYYMAREVLKSITSEYRKNDAEALMKKAYEQ